MKIEIDRVSVWLFLVMVPLNFVTILMGGVDMPRGLAVFALSMVYLTVAVPMVKGLWQEENTILRIGNTVEWTDTEGVVRKGKLLGQYNGSWLVDWNETDYSIGALPPNELRKVRK